MIKKTLKSVLLSLLVVVMGFSGTIYAAAETVLEETSVLIDLSQDPSYELLAPDETGNITYRLDVTMQDDRWTYIYLLPDSFDTSRPLTDNMIDSPMYLRIRGDSPMDFQWYRGGSVEVPGAGNGGSWAVGDTITAEMKYNVNNRQVTVTIYSSSGQQIWTNSGAMTVGAAPLSVSDPLRFLAVYTKGRVTLQNYMPSQWGVSPDPENPFEDLEDFENGDYYIHAEPTTFANHVTYEIYKPLFGTTRNEIEFDMVVQNPGSSHGYLSFFPMDRTILGSASRLWTIEVNSGTGNYHILNNGSYTNTGIAYSIGNADHMKVAFDFAAFTYQVTINGTDAGVFEMNRHSGSVDTDGNGLHFGPANTVGIIGTATGGPNAAAFDVRNISVGITNLVDNDALRNLGETNPVVNADGTKTYLIGPNRKYQKVQDVLLFLEAGDTAEIQGDCEYPAPVILQNGSGAQNGTAEAPITLSGVQVNGEKPRIRSAGAYNVTEINASHWVLDGLTIQGHLQRAAEVRSLEYDQLTEFTEHWTSFRSVFVSGGGDNVIRNSEIFDSYQGIQCGTTGNLLIEYNDIYRNGTDPYGHNLYLGSTNGATTRIQYNYIHDTVFRGNNGLKTRSWRNEVYNNTFYNCDQAMELLSSTGDTAAKDSEIIGNLIIDCRQGMRLGGDGTGPGTQGRYRILNNTYVNQIDISTSFIRTFTKIESVEVYNNLVYSANPFSVYIDQNNQTQWISGEERLVGTNNWFGSNYRAETLPAGFTENLVGSDPGFVNISGYDFHITPDSEAADAGVSASTLYEWEDFTGNDWRGGTWESTFIDPLLEILNHPVNRDTMTVDSRVQKDTMDIGAFGVETHK